MASFAADRFERALPSSTNAGFLMSASSVGSSGCAASQSFEFFDELSRMNAASSVASLGRNVEIRHARVRTEHVRIGDPAHGPRRVELGRRQFQVRTDLRHLLVDRERWRPAHPICWNIRSPSTQFAAIGLPSASCSEPTSMWHLMHRDSSYRRAASANPNPDRRHARAAPS